MRDESLEAVPSDTADDKYNRLLLNAEKTQKVVFLLRDLGDVNNGVENVKILILRVFVIA